MIELEFAARDVAHIRFAFSPLWEVTESLRALARPDRAALHIPWVRSVRARFAPESTPMLRALVRPHGYVVDFLTPPPGSPLPDLGEELDALRATAPEMVRRELGWFFTSGGFVDPPAALRPLFDDPVAGLRGLAREIEMYWQAALAGVWPTVVPLLEGDVLRRSRRLTAGGASALFADLHPLVHWSGEALRIDKSWDSRDRLNGRGLLLVPSVFCWPDVMVLVGEPYQPALLYPALGAATLWEESPAPPPGALAALLGTTRAGVLAALDAPAATTELARRLDVTPGAVSQHLTVLRNAALVAGHRVGRQVLYARTPTGETLVRAPER